MRWGELVPVNVGRSSLGWGGRFVTPEPQVERHDRRGEEAFLSADHLAAFNDPTKQTPRTELVFPTFPVRKCKLKMSCWWVC